MFARTKIILLIGAIATATILLFQKGKTKLPAELTPYENQLPKQVSYNKHIRPLLSDRCFKCHGPDLNKRKADLRLDIQENAYAKNPKSGKRAIAPGDLDASEAFRRIMSHDPEEIMPSKESHLSLTQDEKALIGKWIQQGAKYETHWAYVPPVKSPVPTVKNKEWIKNPIDNFILSQLEENRLQPNAEATKETLLRRLSLDLTGLPPTPTQIDSFLSDPTPQAYEHAVDRLLATPQYGERMAVDWMDLSRYADSHGYQDDGWRNVWPWRDWVIKAFNQNMPYDEFIKWQLAGDLLPNPTQDMLLATCFNRNHPQTQEGGVIDEEYRTEYVIDRTNTLGKAFLGLTVECARCHDHKYDPIKQKDFYQLFAYFNNNNETGIVPYNGEAAPTIMLIPDSVKPKLDSFKRLTAPLEAKLLPDNYIKDFQKWLAQAEKTPSKFQLQNDSLLAWLPFDEPDTSKPIQNKVANKLKMTYGGDKDRKPLVVEGKFGKAKQLIGDCAFDINPLLDFERNQSFTISVWVKPLKLGEAGVLFAKTNGDFEGWRGYNVQMNKDLTLQFQMNHVYPANCINISTTEKLTLNDWNHIVLTYDGTSKASGLHLFLNGQEPPRNIITDNLQKSIEHGVKKSNWSYMSFMMGKTERTTLKDIAYDEFKGFSRQLSALEVQELYQNKPGAIAEVLKTPSTNRTKEQTDHLFEYYLLNQDPNYKKVSHELMTIRGKENLLITDQPEVMVFSERKLPRKSYLLKRGAYDAPADEVSANTPSFLPASATNTQQNRLTLVNWLTDPQNPLFARVTVNRFWANYFGKGICASIDDFGSQGSLPTHPELLDYLAITFRESGWNVKALQKLIVMSATYRQSSNIPPQQSAQSAEKDPDNKLYSRGPSFRLSSEMVRDQALAASGLLVKTIGGKSVYPYQPAGLWEALATRNATTYKQQHGDSLYRRSLYTIWKRSVPPPSAITFDASEKYACTVKRQKTSTPLQALILMNDPQYMEAARFLAERMMREGGPTPSNRITFAYKALITRAPRPDEITLLTQMYQQSLTNLKKNPDRAAKLLTTGEKKPDKSLNQTELAANTLIASTLLNFEETIVRH